MTVPLTVAMPASAPAAIVHEGPSLSTVGDSMGLSEQDLDEHIELAQPNPEWGPWFEQERLRLRTYLSAEVAIEHIGSTAVPDLLAKPIIDIMIGVRSDTERENVVCQLEAAGYEFCAEARSGRLYLPYRGRRWFNASVIPFGSSLWEDNIALRELLRSSASARRRYSRAKLDAINEGNVRLTEYSIAKSPTIEALLEEAAHGECGGG